MAPQISVVHVQVVCLTQDQLCDALSRLFKAVGGDSPRLVWDSSDLRRIGISEDDVARLEEWADAAEQMAHVYRR